ncbi:Sodium/hydrogen exchanger family-domain-containing protein [Pilobolus umbonatus]|nr:Sodium/hydrogen exchanger family-domain-containing protein [Pilobolus umbonatus]
MQLLFIISYLVLLLVFSSFTRAEPPSIPNVSSFQADKIVETLKKGSIHKEELQHRKDVLYGTLKAVHGEASDEVYALAGAALEDFEAFETFILGTLQIYDQTVNQNNLNFDFRNPALLLTFDFQRAVKISHQKLKSAYNKHSWLEHHDHSGKDSESKESLQNVLQDMLKEISDNADQLEDVIQQNMALFSTDNGKVETVIKLEAAEQNDRLVTIVDQDNNEYVMMRPADTTVIMEDSQLIHDLICILITGFAFGWMFTWIDMPAFFGYILAGITMGPSGLNWIQELIQIETLAQLGVVLIIFVLGLEFSLDKLRKMWRIALTGAVTILFVTILFFMLIGIIIGAAMKDAVFIGACISLSSTAVVVKCIKPEQLDHLYGLLVMQDVILGFMLAIIPALSESGIRVLYALFRTSMAFIIFGLVCYLVLHLVSAVPRSIRRSATISSIVENHELMLLCTIAICMTMLILSEYLGLGMELGCFAAGVIIRSRKGVFETSIKVIEPVRDLFACLFFASIGLHIYPSFLLSEAPLLLVLSAGVIGFKFVAACIILYLFKFDLQRSSTMAIALAQVSEFGFVLASRAKQLSIISREIYYVLLAVTSITLIATPLLLRIIGGSVLKGRQPNVRPHSHHLEEGTEVLNISINGTEKIA